MNRISRILTFIAFIFLSISLAESVFAIVPQVRDVVVFQDGSDTVLNITIYHTPEIEIHYVDTVRVTVGARDPDNLTIGVQPLSPDDTFTVQYVVGPLSVTPVATVEAHCTVNGWSSINWTGTIPEFSPLGLLLASILAISILPFALRKIRSRVHI